LQHTFVATTFECKMGHIPTQCTFNTTYQTKFRAKDTFLVNAKQIL